MSNTFDPYHEWLGIPSDEQPPDYYRLLAIRSFEDNQKVIENAADQRMIHLRALSGGRHAESAQKLLNEVSAARVCLLSAEKKAAYDAELRRKVGRDPAAEPIIEERVPIICTDKAEQAIPERKPPLLVYLTTGGVALAACLILVGWWLITQQSPGDVGRQPPRVVASNVDSRTAIPLPPPPATVADTAALQQDAAETTVPSPDATGEPSAGDIHDATMQDETEARASAESLLPVEQPANEPETDDSIRKPREPGDRSTATVPPTAARAPVPDRATQQGILQMLGDVFPTADSSDADAKLRLSEELVVMAGKASNADERFVSLRRAAELASEAGDAQRMLELVARISEQYEVDRLTVQGAMLIAFARTAKGEERIGTLVSVSASVIEEAMAAERLDLADSLADAVYRACLDSAGQPFRVEALQRRREAKQLHQRWEAVCAAQAILANNPEDEAANTTVGQWYGLVRHDWEKAIPYLARGIDSDLKAVARRELDEPPSDATSQVELADAWWDVAEATEDASQLAMFQRAAFWCRQAKPDLGSSLLAAKVAKRLDQFAEMEMESPKKPHRVPDEKRAPGPKTARQGKLVDIGIENPDQIPVGKVREHSVNAEVRQVNTSADGRVYAAAAWSAGINCWSTSTGDVVLTMPNEQTFYGVSLSLEGKLAIYGGRSPTLHVFDVATGEEVKAIPVLGWQFAQALSRDGKHLLVGTERGPHLWDLARGAEVVRFRGSAGWVEDVCFSGDERFVGTASTDKTARVHLLPTGQEVGRFLGHSHHVRSIALSPDGRFAVSGGDDKVARLWEVASGRELHRVEHREAVWGVAMTGNGRYALSTGGDLQLWDLTNGRRVAQFEKAGTRVALLPDNRFALTARGGHVFLWRLPLTAAGQAFEGAHETP